MTERLSTVQHVSVNNIVLIYPSRNPNFPLWQTQVCFLCLRVCFVNKLIGITCQIPHISDSIKYFFLSDLCHSLQSSLGPYMLLQMEIFHSFFFWLSNIPLYIIFINCIYCISRTYLYLIYLYLFLSLLDSVTLENAD